MLLHPELGVLLVPLVHDRGPGLRRKREVRGPVDYHGIDVVAAVHPDGLVEDESACLAFKLSDLRVDVLVPSSSLSLAYARYRSPSMWNHSQSRHPIVGR